LPRPTMKMAAIRFYESSCNEKKRCCKSFYLVDFIHAFTQGKVHPHPSYPADIRCLDCTYHNYSLFFLLTLLFTYINHISIWICFFVQKNTHTTK
jgi:hypothetical protein